MNDMQKFESVNLFISKTDKLKDRRSLVYETQRFLFIPYFFILFS